MQCSERLEIQSMKRQKKVLIVSYYFPPLNNMAAKRYGIMCKYLEQYGYTPYVLTTKAHQGGYLNSKLDLETPINTSQIIRIGMVGISYPIYDLSWLLLCNYVEEKKLHSRVVESVSIGWYQKIKKELDLSKLKDMDIILGTFPPCSNIIVARYLAKRLRKPYVAEIRDLISDYNESVRGLKRSRRLDRLMEYLLLKDAEGIVAVTKGFRDILRNRYYGKKMMTVYNGWDADSKTSTDILQRDRYLYYAGSLYEHRLESLELLLHVITEIKSINSVKMILRSVGPENLDRKAKDMICNMNLQERVLLLPSASEEVVRKEQSSAFINVVLSTIHEKDRSLMTTVPGKLYELLQADAPILAVVPDISEISDILQVTQKGIATIEQKEMKDFILNTYCDYQGNRTVSFFSRKHQAKRLCKFMDCIV